MSNTEQLFMKLHEWIPIDKVDWSGLSRNPNAIHLLEKNLDKVDWGCLSYNPNIFTFDYKAIKDRMFGNGGIKEDLMKNRFAPKNIYKWKGWGFGLDDDGDDTDTEYDTYEEWLKH